MKLYIAFINHAGSQQLDGQQHSSIIGVEHSQNPIQGKKDNIRRAIAVTLNTKHNDIAKPCGLSGLKVLSIHSHSVINSSLFVKILIIINYGRIDCTIKHI